MNVAPVVLNDVGNVTDESENALVNDTDVLSWNSKYTIGVSVGWGDGMESGTVVMVNAAAAVPPPLLLG